ncbi:MAG: pyrroline-5-carboxylate reductase [Bacteroidia bacterium]|nr:pyrroline-5-carboxylate reductase [Bacteroidia bacterium]
MKVLIIGAGNMGTTYAQSFITGSVVRPEDMFFLEKGTGKAAELRLLSSNPLQTVPGEFVREMDLIILSVKPQDFAELARTLTPFLRKDQLILSIMAGITVKSIFDRMKVEKIVRAMPNLPAQVGQGMTVFTTSKKVSKVEIFAIQNLLNTTGKTLYTPHEPMLDAATAVSGSGPAFVYYFMNAMMDGARQMGFSDSEAQLLVTQTFLGAINLLNRNSLNCQEWIEKVSSKGGTTEAAMRYFSEVELNARITHGLEEARKRAEALSNP